jgi:cell wall assembly/cell proliferation coordinating protein, KNR4-like protein
MPCTSSIATIASLAAAKTALGFVLDPVRKVTWQSVNGSDEWQTVFTRPGYAFLFLEATLRERAEMAYPAPQYDGYAQGKHCDPRIGSGWYQAEWLPFVAPDRLPIADYSPSRQYGQIIAFSHNPDTISYLCTDFAMLPEQSLATIRQNPEDYLPEE